MKNNPRPELPGLSTIPVQTPTMSTKTHTGNPILFGHRGLSSKAPENTMASFKALLATDAQGVELDVQLTSDDQIVIHHDYTLTRTAGVDLKIASTPLSEIQKHSVGSWFAPEFESETIPLLTNLFDIGGKTLYYDVEIKESKYFNKKLVKILGEIILDFGLEDHVIVSSFNPLVLREFGKTWPAIRRGCIYSAHKDVPWYLRSGFGQFISGGTFVKPHHPIALEKLRQRQARHKFNGKTILPWTVNNAQDALNLKNAGVWGLISDDPTQLFLNP